MDPVKPRGRGAFAPVQGVLVQKPNGSTVQGWIERSVGFGQEHFTLQGRTFTSVAPSSLIRYGVRMKVSSGVRLCTSAVPSRRLPRPHSSRPHGHDPPACGREVGGRLAQGPRPVRLHPCVRRRHWAPTNEFMTWRWSIDLLSLLALPAAPRRSTSWRELMDVSCWVCRYSTAAPVLPTGAAHLSLRS